MKKLKISNGSVLAFSLIVLSLMGVIALGVISVTIINKKMASSTDKSTQAFQIANSGTEIFLKKMKDNSDAETFSDLGCSNGEISGNFASGDYTITFYNKENNPLDCNDDISDVDHIRSVGKYASNSRAVEVAVAAGGCCKWYDLSTAGCLSQSDFDKNGPTGICYYNGGFNKKYYGYLMTGGTLGDFGCYAGLSNSCVAKLSGKYYGCGECD